MQCEIISRYFAAMNQVLCSQKAPRDYNGILLYHAEINFIDAIHQFPQCNTMELSGKLNVTRGAVSQLGNKLEDKGLVKRYSKDGNKKEVYYELTDLGEDIRLCHKEYHMESNRQMCEYLSGLSAEKRETIMNFLDKVTTLPISDFECSSDCKYH